MPARVLVLGGRGMLGRAVAHAARRRGTLVGAPGRDEVDLAHTDAVEGALARLEPDLVINCAAFTQVDACEEQEALATEINGDAAGRAAAAAARRGARFLQVSTDYVFDGRSAAPYDTEHPTAPIQAYGRSKLRGEETVLESETSLVARTSWLFGPEGPNFVDTMLRLAGERDVLQVVDDQIGCPTYTPHLADDLLDLAQCATWGRDAPRRYHVSHPEPVSWNGFARAIFEEAGVRIEVQRVPTEAFPRPAPRPRYSVLDTSRTEEALGRSLRPWREGLRDYLSRREERAS